MAKKRGKRSAVAKDAAAENLLPQNIMPVGEHVEENKNIYISQKVYREIHKFAEKKTVNESGGVLVGRIIQAFDKTHIVIEGFIEAQGCEATPTTLTFTHETWNYWHKMIDKKFPSKKIVGWIHTHPNFGIFLSGHDKFIQENFFRADYEVAFVVDPIQNTEGFFFWINGSIERCKGFYLFDKPGIKITEGKQEASEVTERREPARSGLFKNILLGVLTFCVAALCFSLFSLHRELNTLKASVQKNASSIEDGFRLTEDYLNELFAKISDLEQRMNDADMTETTPTEHAEPTENTAPEATEELPPQRDSTDETSNGDEAG